MKTPFPIVLSASRRTDIPAFYMPWFMEGIEAGFIDVENPYNRELYRVDVCPERVHSIVFWSKNYGPYLNGSYDCHLRKLGYHLFFHFTLNAAPLLEPGVPPLRDRLEQLERLCLRNDPRAIAWRFDPICHFFDSADPSKTIQNNLEGFTRIAQKAATLGIRRCITSFFDDYAKVRRRARRLTTMRFWDPPLEEKINILNRMETTLRDMGITLYTCCERTVMDALPVTSTIQKSACIPHDILVELFGGSLPGTVDRGQRRKLGCGCQTSRDIGSYRQQPCRHNCLYCYASPTR